MKMMNESERVGAAKLSADFLRETFGRQTHSKL
jgi:hypothetical protein